MNILSAVSAAGTFVRDAAGKLASAAASGVEKAAMGEEHAAETTAQGAISALAHRIQGNEAVNELLQHVGEVAATPTQKALEPRIIVASVLAVIAVAIIVYLARRK